MTLEEVIEVLYNHPFWFNPMKDYIPEEDHISTLGIFEDTMEHLRNFISDDWAFVERRRNPYNDFLRIDIVKKT